MLKTITILLVLVTFGLSGLTNAQIPTDSLVGYWPFNGNANDESGNGNDGTVNGATLTTDRFGNANSAYYFDGTSYITINNTLLLNTPEDYTISCWISVEENPLTSKFIICDRFGGNYSYKYCISVDNGDTLQFSKFDGSTSSKIRMTDTLSNNTWYYVVATFNTSDDSLRLYCNSNYVGASKNNSNWNSNNNPTVIGRFDGPSQGHYMEGKIDDIRVYNRVLDSTEIAALYYEDLCFQTITVTDTLIINANLTGYNPVTYFNTIKIYPNPTHDHIYIKSDNNSMGYQIKIINTLSQIVYQTTINQTQYYVDLNTWTGNGTYFVQLYDTNGNLLEVRKIILE